MVLGNEMDVQHTHRWQNRDVFFLMDSALLKKKEREERRREGSDIVENKVCIWLCWRIVETGCLLHLQRDILLWDWINARIRLLPMVSRAKMQWQLGWLFLLVWQTAEWKKVEGRRQKKLKLQHSHSLSYSVLSFSFLSRSLYCLAFCHWNNPL